jgi:hypothetical protein
MLGTVWVAKSCGATAGYWLAIVRQCWPNSWTAITHLKRLADLSVAGEEYRTNLAMTGGGLCIYDVERIAQCE